MGGVPGRARYIVGDKTIVDRIPPSCYTEGGAASMHEVPEGVGGRSDCVVKQGEVEEDSLRDEPREHGVVIAGRDDRAEKGGSRGGQEEPRGGDGGAATQ